MRIGRRPSRIVDDKNLVADQPGGTIFFSGLLIALVIGVALRGLLAPEKIRALVEQASSRIHPELQVSLEAAHVSLARGPLPRLAVIVEKVRMESRNTCWMAPRLFANEIRLPISFWRLLIGEPPFGRVEAGEVELRLTQPRTDCGGALAAAVSAESSPPSSGVVTLVGRSQPPQSLPVKATEGQLEALQIDRLLVVSEVAPAVNLDLRQFRLRLKSLQPRVLQMQAKTDLLKDPTTGDFLSHANIHVEYKEFPETSLQARFFGNWREGSYSVGADFQPEEKTARFNADLKHIPLSQVLSTLAHFKLLSTDFNPRQSWLSFSAQSSGSYEKWREMPVELKNVKLEGDLGDIAAEKLEILGWEPMKLAPLRLEIRSLDFDRLLQFLQRPEPHPAIGRLGQFRGVAEIRSREDVRLIGELTGLQFVFSNKGRREMQTLTRWPTDLSFEKGRWRLEAGDAELAQGVMKSSLRVDADRDFRKVQLVWKATELTLTPAVQKLMTAGGEIGALKADLNLNWDEGRVRRLRGDFKVPTVSMEGLRIEKFSASLETRQEGFVLSPTMERVTLSSSSPAFQLLRPALAENWVREGSVGLTSVRGRLSFQRFQELRWQDLRARVENVEGASLSSDGGWRADGSLGGALELRQKNQKKTFRVLGTRDQPRLESAQ